MQRDFRKIMTLAQVTEALLFFTRRQREILVSSTRYEDTAKTSVLNHTTISTKKNNWIGLAVILLCAFHPVYYVPAMCAKPTCARLCSQEAYHSRLLALSDALKNSLFFRTHEVGLNADVSFPVQFCFRSLLKPHWSLGRCHHLFL